MCSCRRQLIGALLFPCLVAAQTPHPVPNSGHTATTREFHDPVSGVSFHYPAGWQLNQGSGAYFPAAILTKDNPAADEDPYYTPTAYVSLVGRDAIGGPYQDSNFINAWFLYRIAPELSEPQCYRQAGVDSNDTSGSKLDRRSIGGLNFQHGSSGEAGLCNESQEDVYATFHHGRCYLFEKQINTTCPGSGRRDVSASELEQINRALNAVVQSVRLTDFSDFSASRNSPSSRPVAHAIEVPFVGCSSDGQVGPLPPPAPESISVVFPAAVAQRLSYYKAANGIGTLAPRGWHCFSTYGSAGSNLYVTPGPIDRKSLVSSDKKMFSGPAIQVSVSYGDTSGTSQVARMIARAFPNRLDFLQNGIAQGTISPGSFPPGPYPTDKMTYRGKGIVEFETPAHTQGLGTDSMLRANSSAIQGVAILFGEETNLAYASLRLSPGDQILLRPIIGQIEKEALGQDIAAGPQSLVRRNGR